MGNSATLGETESPSVADKSGISKAASAGATSIKSLTGATESLSFKGVYALICYSRNTYRC